MQGDLLESLLIRLTFWSRTCHTFRRRAFDQLPREVREFEPRVALDGGADGLVVIRRLLAQLAVRAKPNAIALLEISEEQGASAMKSARQILPHAEVLMHRDLEELDRVLELRWATLGVASTN